MSGGRIDITNWKLFRTQLGTTHIVGITEVGRGTVTASVEAFDCDRLVARTATGAVYRLAGSPGTDSILHGLWDFWCRRNSTTETRELSLYDLVILFEGESVGASR